MKNEVSNIQEFNLPDHWHIDNKKLCESHSALFPSSNLSNVHVYYPSVGST